MAKPNINTASRDELIEAGVRADLVDEIMKRRRRKGGITLESLDEVPGVGPATLEQLGKALDFKEPPNDEAGTQEKSQPSANERPTGERRSDDRARTATQAPPSPERSAEAGKAALREGAGQTGDVVAATVRAGAEVTSRAADTMRHAVESGAKAADQGARAGLQVVQRTADVAEETQRKIVERSVEDASAFGRTFLELLQEQSQENMAAMTAIARARGLDEVVKIQGEYLRGTMERMTELNRRWLELAGTMWPGAMQGADRGGRSDAGSAARSSDRTGGRR